MWADTCSPATVTLMDTAASLVSARAALTHPGRTTLNEPTALPPGMRETISTCRGNKSRLQLTRHHARQRPHERRARSVIEYVDA